MAHIHEDIQLQARSSAGAEQHSKGAHAVVGSLGPENEFIDDDEGLHDVLDARFHQRDADNMRRMGKEQQLVRHFRLMSIASFVAIATATWEIGLFVKPMSINVKASKTVC